MDWDESRRPRAPIPPHDARWRTAPSVTHKPAPAPKLEIVRASNAHAPEIAEFIRQVWDAEATPASVIAARQRLAAENVAEPGVAPPTYIAVQAGRVLGYVTTIGVRWWDGQDDHPAYLIKGLMVLPEFRSGPIGYHVLKAANELPRTAGLAVAAPAIRLFTALGYQDLGAIPNLIRPLAPGRILQRLDLEALGIAALPSWAPKAVRLAQRTGLAGLVGGLGGVLAAGVAGAARLGGMGLTTELFDPVSHAAELDMLWLTARSGLGSAVVRDAAYMVPRYPTDRAVYTWVAARRGGRLAGIGVVRQPRADGDPRLKGVRVATLADFLFTPTDSAAALAVLGAAEGQARKLGADAMLASSSVAGVRAILRRQLYLPLGGNVHLLLRDTKAPARFGAGLEQWFLTRGDGLADEVF